jgi:hypothetical protein
VLLLNSFFLLNVIVLHNKWFIYKCYVYFFSARLEWDKSWVPVVIWCSPRVWEILRSSRGLVLSSSVVNLEVQSSGETRDYKIGFCCFIANLAELKSKSNNCLTWNQKNVTEQSDMSTHRLLFQWNSTI